MEKTWLQPRSAHAGSMNLEKIKKLTNCFHCCSGFHIDGQVLSITRMATLSTSQDSSTNYCQPRGIPVDGILKSLTIMSASRLRFQVIGWAVTIDSVSTLQTQKTDNTYRSLDMGLKNFHIISSKMKISKANGVISERQSFQHFLVFKRSRSFP